MLLPACKQPQKEGRAQQHFCWQGSPWSKAESEHTLCSLSPLASVTPSSSFPPSTCSLTWGCPGHCGAGCESVVEGQPQRLGGMSPLGPVAPLKPEVGVSWGFSTPREVQGHLLWPGACGVSLRLAVPKPIRLKECNMQIILFPCTGWTGARFSQDEEKSILETPKQRSADHPLRYLWHPVQNWILTAARHDWQRNKVLVLVTHSFSRDPKC